MNLKKFLPVLIALILGLAAGALFFRGGGGDHSMHNHSSGGDTGKAKGAAGDVWTCSMHPSVRAPKPGKCPICAMNLIPARASGGSGEGREFSMSEIAKSLAGIQTSSVKRFYPEADVHLYGTVEYDETKKKTISARFPGRIDRLFIDFIGIRVTEGDHLATIYSPELLAAQTELLTAKRFNNESGIRIGRDKLRLWGFSEDRIEEIEKSGKTSDHLTIDAPASGIVTHKNVSEGNYVETGMPLFTINDLSQLWIVLDAYESDKPWLRFGQSVTFTAEALPGKKFEGRISFVAPELSTKTRTFSIRVNMDNREERLKPGMFVRGIVNAKVAGEGKVIDPSLAGKWISPMHPEIVKDTPGKCDVCGMDLVPADKLGYTVAKAEGKPPLTVPVSAVLNTGKRSVVYVEKPNAKEPTYEGREILVGPRAGDVYLVEAGLREGERVVTEGAFVIDSALQIQARPSMMMPKDGAAPLYRQFELEDKFLTAVDPVVQKYFDIQSALASDDFTATQAEAAKLALALGKVPVPVLEKEAANVWLGLKDRMTAAAGEFGAAGDIKAARVAFEPLTKIAEELVRRFGTGEIAVYQAYCPMAFSNKGANWLQKNEELRNPYFGSLMLSCGEIKEQLAGKSPEMDHKEIHSKAKDPADRKSASPEEKEKAE